ncbi:TPA: glycosyltransferase [Escherichia coli]|nr:glycosyltransferase [Escherichia coli]
MSQSRVKRAAQAFRDGDYATAISIYRELSKLLGSQYFATNIALCQMRMADPVMRAELVGLPAKQLRVAGVMDEFTFHSYDPECQLLQLHPEHCVEQLEQFKPHLLFIESAWQGLDQLWKQKISTDGPEINACIDWCKDNGIPTLFWNKEDPVHFGTFLPLAKRVDYVFTTDMDCVPKYKFHVGHDRVFFLPFAAQPRVHNPIEVHERKDAFNFAGSYYLRYPERQRDFASLIDAVKDLRPVDIYDRNADNEHPHYRFPEEYRPLILGKLPFAEIDRAYKGYRYGINMNTIKQSQTMFARRVYELMASNTIVISNFSRGARLLFGDLIVSSDNQGSLASRVRGIINDDVRYRKLRLLGLRKVMSEHTYAHRLAYIRAKVTGQAFEQYQPVVALVAQVGSRQELERVRQSFKAQAYLNKKLYLIGARGILEQELGDDVLVCVSCEDAAHQLARLPEDALVGALHADDCYGTHYLTDLVLASTYSQAPAFGKSSRYVARQEQAELHAVTSQYREVASLPMRAALARLSVVQSRSGGCRACLEQGQFEFGGMLAIDEFNYIEDGAGLSDEARAQAMDLIVVDQGVSFNTTLAPIAENLKARLNDEARDSQTLPQMSGRALHDWIQPTGGVSLSLLGDRLRLVSSLRPGQHVYLYAKSAKSRGELNLVFNSQIQLHGSHSADLRTVFEFQDEHGNKISHQMNRVGEKHSLVIPPECQYVRFGLRVEGPGEAIVDRLVLGSAAERPATLICRSPYLVLAKQYPAYDDLYRYGFLHSRVRAYKQAGQLVDIYKIQDGPAKYREFEDIDVAVGDAALLDATLASGQIKHVLVHILDQNMWRVLEKYIDRVKVTVWAHGSEIQAWWRREFEFEAMIESEVARQKRLSDKRMSFWRGIFSAPPANLHMVFVSSYFAQEVFEDLQVSLPADKYSIIHNPIDTRIFGYQEKSPDQRKKILSIRSYASRKYANDLSVQAIMVLSERPFFKQLQFKLIGDGALFEETVAPLQTFANVSIERRFITHQEVAEFQKEYGVFLNPTRWDSQGVSRDEAMASGLVPISNAVAAVPEFMDENSGILVGAEDAQGLAQAIERLYMDPLLFSTLSARAAERVRSQSDVALVAKQEMDLFV